MDSNIKEMIKCWLRSIYNFQFENGLISTIESVALKVNLNDMNDKKLLGEYKSQLDSLIEVRKVAEKQLKNK